MIKKLITIIALTFSIGAWAEDNDEAICKEFLKIEDMNKTFPRKFDETTEIIQISVNCDTTTIKYSKRILVDVSMFNEGWEARKQRQHNQLHCNANGLTSNSGWTAMDVIASKDYEYLTTLTTTPKDCK